MPIWPMFIAAMLASLSAFAEEDDSEACQALKNAEERVKCLSASALLSPLQTPVAAEAGAGLWKMRTAPDPESGEAVEFASLRAEQGRNRWNSPPWLTVRCKANKTELYITWGDNLPEKPVTTYALGSSVKSSTWKRAADRTAAFYPTSPLPVLKQLDGMSNLSVTVDSVEATPINAIFLTSGAEMALSNVRKACGW